MRNLNYEGPGCPVEVCTKVITGKWKGEILHQLLGGSKRRGELHRFIPGATKQILTEQLEELQAAGIVECHVREGMPKRIEYSLTKTGKDLKPVIKAAWQWGRSFLESHPSLPDGSHALDTPNASPAA